MWLGLRRIGSIQYIHTCPTENSLEWCRVCPLPWPHVYWSSATFWFTHFLTWYIQYLEPNKVRSMWLRAFATPCEGAIRYIQVAFWYETSRSHGWGWSAEGTTVITSTLTEGLAALVRQMAFLPNTTHLGDHGIPAEQKLKFQPIFDGAWSIELWGGVSWGKSLINQQLRNLKMQNVGSRSTIN